MNGERSDFWFRAKTYGYGWGLPVCWQGWAVLVGYFALLFGGIRYFAAQQHDVRALVIFLIVITLLLVVIMAAKGERPLRWRWGGR